MFVSFTDVYERLSAPGSKPSFFNMMATQLISGIWHGVFPGYWLFFITSAFMFQASRVLYRYEANLPSKIRNFLPWYLAKVLMSALVLSYTASAFMVLSYHESVLVWKSVSYYGHIWIFVLLVLSNIFPPRKKKHYSEKKDK